MNDRLILEHDGKRYVLDTNVKFRKGETNEVIIGTPTTSVMCFAVEENTYNEVNIRYLRKKIQKMINDLKLTSTNEAAEKLRKDIRKVILSNKWAAIKIINGKVEVGEGKK